MSVDEKARKIFPDGSINTLPGEEIQRLITEAQTEGRRELEERVRELMEAGHIVLEFMRKNEPKKCSCTKESSECWHHEVYRRVLHVTATGKALEGDPNERG